MANFGVDTTFTFFWERVPLARDAFLIEVRDGGGQLVAYLRDLMEASLEVAVNGPARLELVMGMGNAARGAMVGRNGIWLRRKGEASPDHVFEIAVIRESRADRTARYVCWDPLYQLTRERIYSYDDETTIEAIVTEWLSRQVDHRALSLGGIDVAIGSLTRRYVIEDRQTILHAMQSIQMTLDARTMIWVDWQRRLWWTVLDGDVENQVFVGRGAVDVEREVRNDQQVTRLTVFGANQGGRRVRLSDAEGYDLDYVEDETGRWNYRRQIVVNRSGVSISSSDFAGTRNYVLSVSLASDGSLAEHGQSDGSDVAFFDSGGGALLHELVSYSASTGALEALVEVDVSAVVDTVLYMYYGGEADSGGGIGGLSAGGGQPDYTVGGVVAQAGVVPGIRVLEQVVDPEFLLTWAQAEIERVRVPKTEYRIDVMDLQAVDRYPLSSFTLGRLQHVVDYDYGLDVTHGVTGIRRNLLDPVDVVIEIGTDPAEDLDPLAGLIESAEIDDRTTYLWAGDVNITPDPDGDYPGGPGLIDLDDWQYGDGSGWIDGSRIKGVEAGQDVGAVVHGHRVGRILSGGITGGVHGYTVRIYDAGGKDPLDPVLDLANCIVPDDSISQLATGALVWVYVPSEEARSAGEVGVIVVAAGGGETAKLNRHGHMGQSDGGGVASVWGAF